jgi:dipeptidyl-peptidase-4
MKPRSYQFFIFLIALSVSELTGAQSFTPVTVSEIFQNAQFNAKSIEGIRSMADGEHYTVSEDDQIIARYDYATGLNKTVILDLKNLPGQPVKSFSDYTFSNDEKKILLTTERSAIYRHSFEAVYLIYDILARTLTPLTESGKQQLASFSPDGTRVAYMKENNLFYRDLSTGALVQVTHDGKINSIINGAPDWVYEEEFGFSQGYCWSPDSRYLAFYQFDESRVRQFEMTIFNGLYPQTQQFKYPKAGEDNATVSIHVFEPASGKTTSMDVGSETDQYIPRILWSPVPGKLGMIRLNRLQNKVDILLADAVTGKSELLYTEENKCFISRVDDDFIFFTPDRKYFIVLSERSGFYHYYRYRLDGKFENPVTQGNWEVQGLLGFDEKAGVLYYTSNEASTIQTDVYSVKPDGTGGKKLSRVPGTSSAAFSSNFRYFIQIWSDANTPYRYSLHEANGHLIRVLEDNTALVNKTKEYGFCHKEFIKIPVAGQPELNAYLIKPPDFDSTKKYPLFISVYGGPESQDVKDAWDSQLAWDELLTQHGIVIARIDNRGTDGRGEAFRKSTYLQLGKLETEDQVNAAKYLGRLGWIDESRIGIWGWSYGGYMTLLCMTKGAEVFKMGIAVAPVTNWRFYDTIYTERFMRKPQDNASGYDDNSPINHAGALKGKLLLIHGTADDNVHFQNSVEMADRFIKENKPFTQFFYPDKNHSISGGSTRYHLYTMMTDFILENL